MTTQTFTPNYDTEADPWAPVYGREAVYTTYSGERMVGTIEPANAQSSGLPVISFEDGRWGRCDLTIELVA